MEDIFDFVWDVPEGGFKWVETRVLSGSPPEGETLGPILTDGQPLGGARNLIRYAPLKRFTGLFRTFGETPPNEDGILAFANTYGCLGEGKMFIELPGEGQSTVGTGEHISSWLRELYFMRKALELWDAVNDNNLDMLRECIQWAGDAVKYCGTMAGLDGQLIASPQFHPERLELFQPGDLALPALYMVQEIVNKRLQGRVSPRLLWNKDRTKLGLYIVPSSLIGAIWLQFAQAIDGNKQYRRCEGCRTWFELSPEVARTSKLYCSDACRSRAYRKRQAEARRLYEQGKSIEEIAQLIGTEASTVQGWIEKGGAASAREH